MDKQILTTAEAAEFMGIEYREMTRLVKQGHVRRQRGFKNPMKFSRMELNRYLSEGQTWGGPSARFGGREQ